MHTKEWKQATWKALVKSSLKAGDRELAEKIIAESRKFISPIRLESQVI